MLCNQSIGFLQFLWMVVLMEEIRLTSWYGEYPVIYRVLCIQTVCCLGFLPSTVVTLPWQYFTLRGSVLCCECSYALTFQGRCSLGRIVVHSKPLHSLKLSATLHLKIGGKGSSDAFQVLSGQFSGANWLAVSFMCWTLKRGAKPRGFAGFKHLDWKATPMSKWSVGI